MVGMKLVEMELLGHFLISILIPGIHILHICPLQVNTLLMIGLVFCSLSSYSTQCEHQLDHCNASHPYRHSFVWLSSIPAPISKKSRQASLTLTYSNTQQTRHSASNSFIKSSTVSPASSLPFTVSPASPLPFTNNIFSSPDDSTLP